ncbi:hypothetical protein ACJO5Y_14095 [Marinobacter sp. GN3S48]|uniref:hypothetical protein n=1 Tax=Marinobacter sp. GN3S48 TaxID=3382302 RepID=UPI00387B7CC3
MEFVHYEQGLKIKTGFQHNAMGVLFEGDVFPFEGSEERIHFYMMEKLTPHSEGRYKLIDSYVDFEIGQVRSVDIDQLIKAVNIAKERLNRYQSLYLRFKEYSFFSDALEDVINRNDYENVSIFLSICPHCDDDCIDDTLIKLLNGHSDFTEKSTLLNMFSDWGTNAYEAIREYCRAHSQYESDFSRFLLKKLEEFELNGLLK